MKHIINLTEIRYYIFGKTCIVLNTVGIQGAHRRMRERGSSARWRHCRPTATGVRGSFSVAAAAHEVRYVVVRACKRTYIIA